MKITCKRRAHPFIARGCRDGDRRGDKNDHPPERALRNDDVEAAWTDLIRVETFAAQADPGVSRLRDVLIRLGLASRKKVKKPEPTA